MLTDHLTEKLAAADRGFQRQRALSIALQALGWVFALVIVLFALDVALHLESGWRVTLALGLLALLASGGGYLFYVAQVRRNKLEQVARQLEARDPALGSSLINSLQLREQAQRAENPLTRSLAERAVGNYSASLQARDFAPLTKPPTLRRDVQRAGLVTVGVLLLLAALYPITVVELLRYLDPFGDHPPYSFTQVELVEPADQFEVTYNGSIVIKARTSGHRPDDLFLHFHDPAQPAADHALPMYNKGEAGFAQEIENVKSDLLVFASTKNGRSVSKSRRIKVGLVPKIEHAFVRVEPPAYTGITESEAPFDFKKVSALVGSQIHFRLQSNRPLASGSIATAAGVTVPMTSKGENEVAGSITVTESTRLQFSVVDTAGNASHENPSAPLTVTYDLAPEITIDAPAQDGFVCEDATVEVRISARDDYGLKSVRVHRALNEVFSVPKTVAFSAVTTAHSEALSLSPKALGVQAGDTFSIFAEAIDTCPEPHLVQTRTLHLMVISTEEYNDYLRERTDISDIQGKYSNLLNEFHDRVDEQKALTDKIRAQEEKAKDPAAAKEAGAELDKLMAEQSKLNQSLEALADKMENFVREKPLYDVESELQKQLKERADKIREATAENNQALQKETEKRAGEQSQESQVDSLAALEKASREQAEKLAPEQKMAEEQTMPALKDAALMNALVNDFNGVKYLHETQTTLAAQAKAYENRQTLTEEDRLALKQLASTEKAIEWALNRVTENLRKHADEAEEKFPKAAQSGRDLADAIEERRLSGLAGKCAKTMLAGDGAESSVQATRLQQELDQLFAESQQGGGGMKKEFDEYLQLRRGLSSANTFNQMSQCRKFGLGKGKGQGKGEGQGQGEGDGSGEGEGTLGGLDGYATSSSGNFSMFGNETLGGDPKSSGHGRDGLATASGPGEKVEVDRTDSVPTPGVNRLSRSTQSESTMDEYRSVIDAYFNSITK